MRKTTRIVSLILVLLMLVGMMPLALFAADAGEASAAVSKADNAFLDRVGAALPNNNTRWDFYREPTDWNVAAEGWGEYTLKAGTKVDMNPFFGLYAIAQYSDRTFVNWEDGALKLQLSAAANRTGGLQTAEFKDQKGKDFVFSVDIKLAGSTSPTLSELVGVVTKIGDTEKVISLAKYDGRLRDANGTVFTWDSSVALNSASYSTIGFRVDVAANKYYVYFNGTLLNSAGTQFISNADLALFGEEYDTADFELCGLRMFYGDLKSTRTAPIYVDNMVIYTKDTKAADKLVYFKDASLKNVVTLEDDEFTSKPDGFGQDNGDGTFTADTKTPFNSNWAGNTGFLHWLPDGAIRYESTTGSGTNDYFQYNVKQKVDFVFSVDIKLDSEKGIPAQIELLKVFTDVVSDYRTLLNMDAKGQITNSSGSIVFAQLSSDKYTNVACKVNVEENKYYVYVDGICVNPDGVQFLTEDYIAKCTEAMGSEYDPTDFFTKEIRLFHGRGANTKDHPVYFDNLKLCYSPYYATSELEFDGEEACDEEGLVEIGGMNRYVENGKVLDVQLKGWTMSMDGQLGVNYYLYMGFVPNSDAYVEFTVNGSTQTVKLSELVTKDGFYIATVSIPAAEMTDTIKAVVKHDEETVLYTFSDYTGVAYASTILNGNYKAEAKDAVKAMLNYAAAAQVYFNHNTGNLANKDLDEADKTFDVTPDKVYEKIGYAKDGEVSGAAYKSTQLGLEGEVMLYHNFVLEEGKTLEDYTITVDGGLEIDYEETKVIGKTLRVKTTGIKAANLDTNYTVTLTDGEGSALSVTYNAVTYMYLVLNAYGDDAEQADLVSLIKALYDYNVKADAYNDSLNG